MTATLPARTTVTTCAASGRSHQVEAGLVLCRHHFDELADWLWDVQHEWEGLDASLSLQVSWDDTRGGTLASHRAPARIDPIVLADSRRIPVEDLDKRSALDGLDDTLSAFATLHAYASLVRAGRGIKPRGRWVTEPVGIGPTHADCDHPSCRRLRWRHFVPDPLTVLTERQLLSRHLEWAAAQVWAGELWADIRKLRGQLQAANGTGDPKAIPGRCPSVVDGVECAGRLWPVAPAYSAGTFVHAGSHLVEAIECETNPNHRWEGAHLIRLALILEDQQKERR